MTVLMARAVDAAAIAPFGTLIHAPAGVGQRQMFSEWVAPVDGLRPQFHVNRVPPSSAPVIIPQVEQHPHAAQVFVPLDGGPYLVVVMPSRPDGQPDTAAARAWIVPPTLGIAYRPGVWHASIIALEREACFSVMMWRGAPDDDVVTPVTPVAVLL